MGSTAGGARPGMIRVGNDPSPLVCHSGWELAGMLLLRGEMARLVKAEPAGLKRWVCAEGSEGSAACAHAHSLCGHAYVRVCVHIPVWCSGFGLSIITVDTYSCELFLRLWELIRELYQMARQKTNTWKRLAFPSAGINHSTEWWEKYSLTLAYYTCWNKHHKKCVKPMRKKILLLEGDIEHLIEGMTYYVSRYTIFLVL